MNFYYLPDHYLFNIHFFDDNIFKKIWHQRNGVDTGCTRSKNNLARVLWFGLEKKVINYRRIIETRIYFIHIEGIFIMQNLTCHETRWYLFHEARLSYLRCFVSYEQTCMNNLVYVCRHSLFGICCDDKLRSVCTMKRA